MAWEQTPMGEITTISRVELARLLPGDILVLTVPDHVFVTNAEIERMRAQIQAALPAWAKCWVVRGATVKVVRCEDVGNGGETSEADSVERVVRESGQAGAE